MLKLCNIGPKIWSLFPSNISNSETLEIFKQKISYWKPDNSPCRLFKTYIKSFGYLYSIAFQSGFVLKKPLPQITKVFFSFFFITVIFHYVVDLY